MLLIVMVVAIYLLFRVIDRQGLGLRDGGRGDSRRGGHPAGGRRSSARPSAPDDDPEFLRSLDRRRRHEKPDSD